MVAVAIGLFAIAAAVGVKSYDESKNITPQSVAVHKSAEDLQMERETGRTRALRRDLYGSYTPSNPAPALKVIPAISGRHSVTIR